MFEVNSDLGLTNRGRLLDILGDASERAKTVTRLRAWRPWMNAYLATDFLFRLQVPDYFDRRADRRTLGDLDARAEFDAEVTEFRKFVR